jgi:hypothetical protein
VRRGERGSYFAWLSQISISHSEFEIFFLPSGFDSTELWREKRDQSEEGGKEGERSDIEIKGARLHFEVIMAEN